MKIKHFQNNCKNCIGIIKCSYQYSESADTHTYRACAWSEKKWYQCIPSCKLFTSFNGVFYIYMCWEGEFY